MKKLSALLISLLLVAVYAAFGVSASGSAGSSDAGDILYSLDFSGVTTLEAAGLTIGSTSASTFKAEITDGALKVSADSGKGFVIFNNCNVLSEHNSYIIEYTFSFVSALDETGYMCYMFRSDGVEPTGTQDFNFRFNGTNNKFAPENGASMKANITAGKKVTVSIPIIDRYIENATVSVEGESNELTRDPLVLLDEGGKPGLIVKNVDAILYSLTIKKLPAAATTAEVTTAAPAVTTAAPAVTTAAPAITTAAPETTTAAPAVTTATPATTTGKGTTESGGCGSFAASGIIAALLLVPAAWLTAKKKTEK